MRDTGKGKAIICNKSVCSLYFLTVSPHSSFKVTTILDFPEMSQFLLWSWANPGCGNNWLPFALILSWFGQWTIRSVTSSWCSKAIRRVPGVRPWPQKDITSGCQGGRGSPISLKFPEVSLYSSPFSIMEPAFIKSYSFKSTLSQL